MAVPLHAQNERPLPRRFRATADKAEAASSTREGHWDERPRPVHRDAVQYLKFLTGFTDTFGKRINQFEEGRQGAGEF